MLATTPFFMKASIFLMITLLTGCRLYAGGAVHDRSFDSEFKQDGLLCEFGIVKKVSANSEAYLEHESQCFESEKNGANSFGGINKVGFKIMSDIF